MRGTRSTEILIIFSFSANVEERIEIDGVEIIKEIHQRLLSCVRRTHLEERRKGGEADIPSFGGAVFMSYQL